MSIDEYNQHVELSKNLSKDLNPVWIYRNPCRVCEELLEILKGETLPESFSVMWASVLVFVSVGIDRQKGPEHFSTTRMRNSGTERSDYTLLTSRKNQQKIIT